MSGTKINLEVILKQYSNICFDDYEGVMIAMKEACRQTLELVSVNIGFIETNSDKLNSEEYQPFITADDDTVWTINKQSILDLIDQIN